MRKNRTLPYGYQVIAGAASINEPEAEVVRRVFRSYASGKSYKAIAEALTESGSRYLPDKPEWNKNIVARMLQNQVYLGNELYPPLLSEDEYRSAQAAKKPYTLRQAPELKEVCGMLVCGVCGAPVRRRNKPDGMERWYCENDYRHIPPTLTDAALLDKLRGILGCMAEAPETVTGKTCASAQDDIALARLENEISAMLDRAPENTEETLGMILRLAADKYAAINEADTENMRIRQTLKNGQTDIGTLPRIADSIAISAKTVISVKLKNGQNISEGESDT